MLIPVTQSRWFDLADLLLALACALAWAFIGSWGWVILAVSLLPWAVRIGAGRFPFRRTALDAPILLFLLTAGIGLWAAYDRSAAWEKFWWLVAASRLYYALAGQRRENFFAAATLVTGTAALLCLLFLLAFDWAAHPLLGPIDRIGVRWMALRPGLPLPAPEPDFIGGLAAMLLPLALVMALAAYRHRDHARLAVHLATLLAFGLGLLMSAERPAWIGLMLAGSLWLGWQGCRWLAGRLKRRAETIAVLGLLVILAAGSFPGLALWQHGARRGSMPGRVDEVVNGAHLAASYPLIGGGLSATAGLYSRYILGIPYLYIPNIRNQYLNIGIEQGLPGLAAAIWLFAGALLGMLRHPPATPGAADAFGACRWAVGLGIVVFGWHGLMEDVAYSSWGAVLLLILPGLAAALQAPAAKRRVAIRWRVAAAAAAAILIAAALRPLMALWHANLGAVLMSRVQLAGWPEQLIDGERLLSVTGPAERQFEQALRWQAQPTANYRLGLLANERRDFARANAYLLAAFEQRPGHRGIRKALGYSYAWTGQIDAAGQTLETIPEAAYELSIYAQWWASQGLNDLSDYARQTAGRLETK
ncbi:MAG: tetratricopeptide repeat protein [Chloroflexota bacterium]